MLTKESKSGRVLQGFFRSESIDGNERAAVGQAKGVQGEAQVNESNFSARKMPRPAFMPPERRPLSAQAKGAPRPELPGMGRPKAGLEAGVAQRRGEAGAEVVTPLVTDGRVPLSGAGRPLERGIREQMEAFFSADFSGVRVHEGPVASAMGALAFTLGDALYFKPGLYQPKTREGMELLAHELTHVVQQREGRVVNPFGRGLAIVQDPALEAEAIAMGRRAGARVGLKTSAKTMIAQRRSAESAIQLSKAPTLPHSPYTREQQLTSYFLGLIRNRASAHDQLIIVREALRVCGQDSAQAIEFLRAMFYRAGAGSLSQSIIGLVHYESSRRFSLIRPIQPIVLAPLKRQPHRLVPVEFRVRLLQVSRGGAFECCLGNYLIINDVLNKDWDGDRAKAISTMRGKDQGFDGNKGYLYLPFLEETSIAVASLAGQAARCVAVFSIERGGALLSDHIENRMLFRGARNRPQFFKISKWADSVKRQREYERGQIAKNVERELLAYIHLYEGRAVTIGFCETMVSGDSANRLLEMLAPVAEQCPNVRFKVLLLRQTLNAVKAIPDHLAIEIASNSPAIVHSQFSPSKKLKSSVCHQFQIWMASVRWIPGEDVDYLTRDEENGGRFDERLIIFDGTDEHTICSAEFAHNGSARQALSQLIAENSARNYLKVALGIQKARLRLGGLAAYLASSGENRAYGQEVLKKLGFSLL